MAWRRNARVVWEAIHHPEHGWKTTHFWGPLANWALVGSAVWDGLNYGPEMISVPMTMTMCVYSGLFMRFAWAVQPRNYLLLSCHAFNEMAQITQLCRAYKYKQERGEAINITQKDMAMAAVGCAGAAVGMKVAPTLQNKIAASSLPASVTSFLNHPAGPFTIFFWAPTTKWLLSASNIADIDRPVDKISTSQQLALASTGLIWSRYSLVITPVNYNLLVVNFVLACTSLFHLSRKLAASQDIPKVIAA
eukprot:TRINITY_DN1730_c1_g1_i1.p1 TRINITY_DN1730_c1_g1~~TRINITY_DN1730_c1_g1_i1.p1  ORF type:complete len:249 (+),score=70.50 TRINITY_DN1730_c1_g1_i1:379-1125(+)